ncbi:MAG TPA: ABC transporter ATP-binding protein, partial [bacterium]
MVDTENKNGDGELSDHDTPAIQVNDLTVAYRDKPVLWDIDLKIPQGVLVAIVGPNGAGKTTLIKSILGLIKPAAGRVKILGKDYHRVRHLVGYVPQRGSVDWDFPANVLDVVMMGSYGAVGWIKRPGRAERDLAFESLTKVGMEEFATRQISQLSGGQQQRVFLARALQQDAQLYLMDEPMQGVDATTERAIIGLLRDIKDKGRT